MLAGEGELAQNILSHLPLRALARLALTNSSWASEAGAALLAPQRWDRYHELLCRMKALVPSESDEDPEQLIGLVAEIERTCGQLDAQAWEILALKRPFKYPPCENWPYTKSCFMHREDGDSWHQRRPVAPGAATHIAFFLSCVIPAAFQLEVHAAFLWLPCSPLVVALVAS